MIGYWPAYLCGVQGHVLLGSGTGTGTKDIVWSTHCWRCGTRVSYQESEPKP